MSDIKQRLLTSRFKKDPKDNRDFLFKNHGRFKLVNESSEPKKLLPKKIDHSKNMSPIKDQGELGSCVSFATAAMKEWQEQQELSEEIGDPKLFTKGIFYDFSESWIYWNAKKLDPWPNEEGTSIRYAMKVLQKIGVPSEKAWPYSDNDYGKPKKWAKKVARFAAIKSYWKINNLLELKTALVKGPVPIGIECFDEIFTVGSNGIVHYPRNPRNPQGGHAICTVGFDDRKRFIKFKNSWSVDWGKDGYGYLPYKYIQDFMWDAWAAEDLNVE